MTLKSIKEKEVDNLAEQLHDLYLQATKSLHPESFNQKAQKPYSQLTEEQKFIDKFIARAILRMIKEREFAIIKRLEELMNCEGNMSKKIFRDQIRVLILELKGDEKP